MKKILYLSFYFEPDLCAGSFRNTPLAIELAKQLHGKAIVEVVSTVPNRYQSFKSHAPLQASTSNLIIHRIKLPAHKSGFLDQAISFYKYYRSTLHISRNNNYDLVFASSSRLFTAFLGYQIATKKSIPLILDIRDIFTDTLSDVIKNPLIKFLLLPIFNLIERKTFSRATHINLISKGFFAYFKKYTLPFYSYYSNGIDNEFIHNNLYDEYLSDSPIIITYAGNIGEGQGLHKIIPQAAKILGNAYLFRVIGDGGAKEKLVSEIRKFNLSNVTLESPVRRIELIDIYKKSNFLFLHLNDFAAFKKVLPSKIFELGAFPRPIIAGVGGYAQQFIRENIDNVILFEPTDVTSLVNQIKKFEYRLTQRNSFVKKFNREDINRQMATMIASYL